MRVQTTLLLSRAAKHKDKRKTEDCSQSSKGVLEGWGEMMEKTRQSNQTRVCECIKHKTQPYGLDDHLRITFAMIMPAMNSKVTPGVAKRQGEDARFAASRASRARERVLSLAKKRAHIQYEESF